VAACPLINSMCQAQKLSTTSTDESISHINSYALQLQLCESARLHICSAVYQHQHSVNYSFSHLDKQKKTAFLTSILSSSQNIFR